MHFMMRNPCRYEVGQEVLSVLDIRKETRIGCRAADFFMGLVGGFIECGTSPAFLTPTASVRRPSLLAGGHDDFRGVAMKISRGVVLASLLAFAATPVFAAFSLNDAANAVSSMQGGQNGNAAAPASGLLSTLGSQLHVTPEQAVGGTGAMLGLAKNKLSGNDYSQLSKSVPGLDQLSGGGALSGLGGLLGQSGNSASVGSALGNVQNTSDLNKAFGALGMDSGMVGQFAPVILQYLGQQGVGGPLLKSLGGIWGAGS
jgi:hypothetical protein